MARHGCHEGETTGRTRPWRTKEKKNDPAEKNSASKGSREPDAPIAGAPDASALLAEIAVQAGIAWRPGDDPSALLMAMEDAGGPLPEGVQEILARVLDAAGALERELASGHGSDKKA